MPRWMVAKLPNSFNVYKTKSTNYKKIAKCLLLLSGFLGWGTRTRTRKGRTRICSVTITPYPNFE